MKILKEVVFAFVLVFFLGFTQSAVADKDGFSISGFAGYYNTSSSVFIDSDVHFETLPAYGGAITYHFSSRISAELSATAYDSVVDVAWDDKYERLGQIKQTALFYTVRYQFPIRKSNSHIYLGLGAGYFDNEFDHFNRSEFHEFFGVNIQSAKINDSVAYLANVGSEMRLSKHFAAYLDLKVIFNQPKFDIILYDGTAAEKDVGMNASLFVLGAKYYF